MKMGGCEIFQFSGEVFMDTRCQIALHDFDKRGVGEKVSRQSIEGRSEAGNGRGKQQASRTQHPVRLSQGALTIAGVDKVIQRTEEQHYINGFVVSI
jgi:hypothetical protein